MLMLSPVFRGTLMRQYMLDCFVGRKKYYGVDITLKRHAVWEADLTEEHYRFWDGKLGVATIIELPHEDWARGLEVKAILEQGIPPILLNRDAPLFYAAASGCESIQTQSLVGRIDDVKRG